MVSYYTYSLSSKKMRSSQRGIIGIFGIILAIIATPLLIISLKNQDFVFLSILLWFIGVLILLWWFKREKSLNLKFAMGIIFTGQIVMFVFGESYIDDNNNFIFNKYILFSSFLIGFGLLYFLIKSRKRFAIPQYFSSEIKGQILKKQNYKCAGCKKFLSVYDFDHIDNDRSNNDYNNCQALCPICHALKTRKMKKNFNK
ncbi:MAG TPA: HNH endonuclease signature motif containing protein [Nitrososphaeraceae archaeon]|nr:HNH endonuclease signature motif containing protein [Nitrososphaeraceae archaeon]